MLAETVDARVWGETSLDTDVLGLEDYGVALGGEEYFVCFCSDDREREGLCGVLEFDFARLGRLGRWAGNNRVGDFVAFHGWVGDLDMNSSVWPRDRQYMRVSSAGASYRFRMQPQASTAGCLSQTHCTPCPRGRGLQSRLNQSSRCSLPCTQGIRRGWRG